MTRSRRTAKDAGTRFETAEANALAWALKNDGIERRTRNGSKDRGDIGGIRTTRGERVTLECKDVATLNLAGWIREVDVERENDGAAAGIVIAKRRGKSDPLDAYAVMTVRDLVVLLGGERAA